jgi:hypothetical protein
MRRHTRTRRAAWFVVLSLALTVLVVPPASADTLSATLTPGSANAGAETTFQLTVTSQVRSLSLAAPAAFFVGSATSSRGSVTVSGNQIRVARINGSQPVTVTITAWPNCTPSTPETPPNTWTLNATGTGSTTYDPKDFSTLVTNDPSSCKLVFGEMADQQTLPPAPTTTPVVVTVTRANGSTDTSFTGAISLSIEVDPGDPTDATLSGGGSPTTYENGVATFSTSLDTAGTGYVLEACSPAINGGACDPDTGNGGRFLSGLFAVYNDVQPCDSGNSCTARASAPGQVDTLVSAPNQSGVEIKAGAYSVTSGTGLLSDLDCAGYDEITEAITSFDYTSDVGIKRVVNTVSAEQMKEIANQGVSFLQVCFGSSLPFTDRFNHAAVLDPTLGLYVGLLPDCPANKKKLAESAPCVVSRQGGGTGTGTITFVADDGDPGGARH